MKPLKSFFFSLIEFFKKLFSQEQISQRRRTFFLATKITFVLGVILTFVVALGISSLYFFHEKELFRYFSQKQDRWNDEKGDIPFLQKNFRSPAIFAPRNGSGKMNTNFIILTKNGSLGRGMLSEIQLSLDTFEGIRFQKVQKILLAGMSFYIYAFQSREGIVIFYEPTQSVDMLVTQVFLIGITVLGIFLLLLFGIIWYFAAQSFFPLETALNQGKLYNRAIAHELKTPLAVIQTELSFFPKEKQLTSSLQEIRTQIQQITTTIDSLLLLSDYEYKFQQTQISLETVWKSLASEIADPIQIQGEFPKVLGEERLVKILFSNIVRNIISYNLSGSLIQITVGDNFFRIKNTPKTHLQPLSSDAVFHPFHQEKEGSGLGLCLLQRICQIHGWKIHISSQKDSFQIELTF